MRINVLPATHPSVLSSAIFPEVGGAAKAWVKNQFEQAQGLFENVISKPFLDNIRGLYNQLNDPRLESQARNFTRQIKGLFHPNTIVPLLSVEEIQKALPMMQRYMMACPDIRTIYHKQLCDGYSDSYVDLEPGVVGAEHYDYRRVMNGIGFCYSDEDEKGKFETWKAINYFEQLREGDEELTFIQRDMVLDAWALASQALAEKIDVTDIFGGSIGG